MSSMSSAKYSQKIVSAAQINSPIKYLQEATVWDGTDINVPNHIYIMKRDFAIGYIKEGTTEEFYFSKPWRLDKKGRRFKELTNYPFTKTLGDP